MEEKKSKKQVSLVVVIILAVVIAFALGYACKMIIDNRTNTLPKEEEKGNKEDKKAQEDQLDEEEKEEQLEEDISNISNIDDGDFEKSFSNSKLDKKMIDFILCLGYTDCPSNIDCDGTEQYMHYFDGLDVNVGKELFDGYETKNRLVVELEKLDIPSYRLNGVISGFFYDFNSFNLLYSKTWGKEIDKPLFVNDLKKEYMTEDNEEWNVPDKELLYLYDVGDGCGIFALGVKFVGLEKDTANNIDIINLSVILVNQNDGPDYLEYPAQLKYQKLDDGYRLISYKLLEK